MAPSNSERAFSPNPQAVPTTSLTRSSGVEEEQEEEEQEQEEEQECTSMECKGVC